MRWVKLGDVAEKVDYGFTEKASRKKVGPKFLRITDIQNDKVDWETVPYCECNEKEFQKNRLESGDIVFARTGATTGKSFLIDELEDDAVYASYLIRLRLKPKEALPEFVSFFFKSEVYWRQISEDSDGATLPSFNATKLKNLQIPLPSLSEQRAIVERLDRAQRLIDIDREMLQRYDDLIQSVFLDMFGDPDGSKVSLADLAEINPKKSEIKSIPKETTVSFLGMSDVGEDGTLSLTETRTIDEVWSGYTYFAEGDVLFAKITPCMENGKGAIVTGLINQIGFGSTEFHVLRPKKNVSTANWLFHLTHSKKFRHIAETIMTGSAGQKRVPTHFFERFKVNKPSVQKQFEFEKIAKGISKDKKRLRSQIKKSEDLFSSLVQNAFR